MGRSGIEPTTPVWFGSTTEPPAHLEEITDRKRGGLTRWYGQLVDGVCGGEEVQRSCNAQAQCWRWQLDDRRSPVHHLSGRVLPASQQNSPTDKDEWPPLMTTLGFRGIEHYELLQMLTGGKIIRRISS